MRIHLLCDLQDIIYLTVIILCDDLQMQPDLMLESWSNWHSLVSLFARLVAHLNRDALNVLSQRCVL